MLLIPITDRATWLQNRAQDVTASEIPALFGISKWKTVLQLWADKTGKGRQTSDNMAMRAGRVMEAAIAAAVQEEKPDWKIRKAEHYYRWDEEHIGATPDYLRVVKNPGGFDTIMPIECKFVQPSVFERDWADGPPLMYVLQTLAQIYLTEAPFGYIAAMVDNRAKDLYIYDVPRNDAAWERIIATVRRFWQDVATDNMPDADYTRDGQVLKDLMPPDTFKAALDFSTDNELPERLAVLENLKQTVKECQSEIASIEALLIAKLDGAPEAKLPGWRISYRMQERKEYTVKATNFSVLRVTKTKEEVL